MRNTAAAIVLFALLLSLPGAAQSVTGTITGSVADPSGAAALGVTVRVTHSATGLVRATQTDSAGNFRFLLLPLGVYTMEAASPGFKAFRREGIVVEADRSLAVPIKLEIGAVTEVVEVTGGSPLLETTTSSLGTVMDLKKIDALPLNARNPLGLASLIPTVRGIGFFGGQVLSSWRLAAISMGGGPALSNSFLIDGIASEKMSTSGTQTFLTVDSTHEFKVVLNSMSAEFGRTGGGILSMVSRSGTNEWHGNVFEFLRSDNLNANDFFSNQVGRPRPTLAWNQFGGTLGGPIARDKLFFFGNYEGFRERRTNQRITTAPTALERSGDFSDTRAQDGTLIRIYDPTTTLPDPARPGRFIREAFAGNRIPASQIDPVGRNLLTYYPQPNLPGLPFTRAQNLFLAAGGPIDRNTLSLRVDYNLGSSRRVFGRYTWDDLDWQFPRYYGTPAEPDGRTVFIPRHSSSLQYTDALTPTLLVDAKAGFNRENEHFFNPSEGFSVTTLGMPESFARATMVGRGADTGRFPRFALADGDSPFGANASRGSPSLTTLSSVAVTKIARSHTIKTGLEHRFYAVNDWGRDNSSGNFSITRAFTQGPDPLVASATAGYGIASLLLGTPASGFVTLQTDGTAGLNYYGLFIQDDWKVTRRLTLNLGLRWDRDGPIADRYNVASNFDPFIPSPLRVPGLSLRGGLAYPGTGGLSRGATEPGFDDFGPRFGFAYQPSRRWVARGGFSVIFLPTLPASVPRTGFLFNTPMVSTLDGGLTAQNRLRNPFPEGLIQPTGSSQGLLTGVGTSVAGQLRDVERGYVEQWNFTVQFEPWDNWLFEAAWVGNHGVRLLGGGRDLNQISDQNFAQGTSLVQPIPNPFRGIIPTGPLAGATITRHQGLLPFPHFVGVNGGYSFFNNSIFHALTVKVEKRFSRGFSLLLSYTNSKLIDDGFNSSQVRPGGVVVTTPQNWNNLRAERSKSAQDIPQRLVWTAVWEAPFGRAGSAFKRQTAGGWQINAITTIESGAPISLSAPIQGGGNRPNVVASVAAKLDNPTLDRWFNTAAFSNPAPYTYGNVSRTLADVHSDGMFNLDLSVFKNFPINERWRLQFRAETFNLTNTPTFETPGRAINSRLFGVVTATAFLPKPREVQFALRLLF